MIYATLKLTKVAMTIKAKSFEEMMKDIGYLMAEYPVKVGDTYTFTFISKKEFDMIMKISAKNPKTKTIEIGERKNHE